MKWVVTRRKEYDFLFTNKFDWFLSLKKKYFNNIIHNNKNNIFEHNSVERLIGIRFSLQMNQLVLPTNTSNIRISVNNKTKRSIDTSQDNMYVGWASGDRSLDWKDPKIMKILFDVWCEGMKCLSKWYRNLLALFIDKWKSNNNIEIMNTYLCYRWRKRE